MVTFARQLVPAFRTLTRRPRFTIPAILVLAVGLGAAAAVFSLVNGVLLKPLPYDGSERIIGFWSQGSWSQAEVDFLREEAKSYESVGAFVEGEAVYRAGDEPRVVTIAEVSPDLFDVLSLSAARGRLFLPDEDQPGRDAVVVISETFWKRELGGTAGVVGTTLELDDHPLEIVGIISGDVPFPSRETELWVPLMIDRSGGNYRRAFYLSVLGRLRQDVSIGDARSELEVLVPRLTETFDLRPGFDKLATRPTVESYLNQLTNEARMPLLMLAAGSLLLLLVACVNIANLMLARSAEREREIAIREAVGARRGDLLAQHLAEAVLLATSATVLGFFVADRALEFFRSRVPPGSPRLDSITLDPAAFLAGMTIAVGTILVFGLVPSLRSSEAVVRRALAGGRVESPGPSRLRWVLVTAEMAMAGWLATMAVSTGRSVVRLLSTNPGFSTEQVVTLRPELSGSEWSDPAARVNLYERLIARLTSAPGVRAAGANWLLPIAEGGARQPLEIEGRPVSEGTSIYWRSIVGDYFDALSIPKIEGRPFDRRDTSDSFPVGIISRTAARQLWPGESAIGKRLRNSLDGDRWITIVGVVGDVRHEGLEDDPGFTIYRPYSQSPQWMRSLTLVVAGRSESSSLLSTSRAVIRNEAPTVPIHREATMESILSDSVARETLTGLVVGVYGFVALALAIFGVFSLLAYMVSKRKRELGIRMALGAQKPRIVWLVIRQGMAPAITGAITGLLLSIGMSQWLSSFLYGIADWDPLSNLTVVFMLCLTALAACLVPAIGALRLDAAAVLREE